MTQTPRASHNTTFSITSAAPLLLALGAIALFALYFLRLGSYPLFDPDEPVYGQVAREMAGGGGWLSPHLNGALWFDKPPLFYWLSALSVSLFGPTEFACRLPSALAALGVIGLVYALARHDFGPRAAAFSALVMMTCLQQIILARAAVTDMTFVLCLTAALYCYRRWLHEVMVGSGAWLFWSLACGAATGLAMLTKGPVAPLLLSLTFLIHANSIGRGRHLRSVDAALAVAMALAVGLPWYIAMYLLHGQQFVQGFLVANNITRFLKAEHVKQTGHWYAVFFNIPVLIGFFFPWSVFLPCAVARLWDKFGRKTAPPSPAKIGLRLALVWCGVIFVFFSISKTQLVTYIFPLYPAAAILVGTLWCEAETDVLARRGVRGGIWAALLLSVLLTVGLAATARHKFPVAQSGALLAGGVLVLACAAALWALSRREQGLSFSMARPALSLGAGMVCLATWLVVGVVPRVAPGESSKELVRLLPPAPATVAAFHANIPSVPFYLGDRPGSRYLGLLSLYGSRDALRRNEPVFIVCRYKDEGKISIPGAGEWARSGKLAIWANAPARALPRGDHAQ